jgi:hypothetical protein
MKKDTVRQKAQNRRRTHYLRGPIRPAWNEDRGVWEPKRMIIKCYSSGDTGSVIRNACTGVKIPEHTVGSADEDLYYTVKYTTVPSQNPVKCFYETPQDFEVSTFAVVTDVSVANRARWNARNRHVVPNILPM